MKMEITKSGIIMPTRRIFVLGAAAIGALALAGCQTTGGVAKPAIRTSKNGLLHFIPDEAPKTAQDVAAKDARSFNYVMRDVAWDNKIESMDKNLHEFIRAVAAQVEADTVWLVSGYRTFAHQKDLVRRKRTTTKVGHHPFARATDIELRRGSKTIAHETVQEAALKVRDEFGFGGVGWYDTFTHIDTRPKFKGFWNLRSDAPA